MIAQVFDEVQEVRYIAVKPQDEKVLRFGVDLKHALHERSLYRRVRQPVLILLLFRKNWYGIIQYLLKLAPEGTKVIHWARCKKT